VIGFRSISILSLGGNLSFRNGTPSETIVGAIRAIASSGQKIRAISRFFSTPCFPAGAGPDYINAAVSVQTDLTPGQLLDLLHRIEQQFGRSRQQRWGARTLDLDMVCYGDLIVPDRETQTRWQALPPDQQAKQAPQQLIVPHPRLQDRAFVLVPMMDIVPGWRHPVLEKTTRELCAALPLTDVLAVRPI